MKNSPHSPAEPSRILVFAYFSGFLQFVRQNVLYKKFKILRIIDAVSIGLKNMT